MLRGGLAPGVLDALGTAGVYSLEADGGAPHPALLAGGAVQPATAPGVLRALMSAEAGMLPPGEDADADDEGTRAAAALPQLLAAAAGAARDALRALLNEGLEQRQGVWRWRGGAGLVAPAEATAMRALPVFEVHCDAVEAAAAPLPRRFATLRRRGLL